MPAAAYNCHPSTSEAWSRHTERSKLACGGEERRKREERNGQKQGKKRKRYWEFKMAKNTKLIDLEEND